ncbi:MAG: UDP-N-acetylmuramoyl-tripeptide--D-alanyl-D-alanine ligase [Anaplasmataceae bacterium]|nr:UDP-N-acetylmuramoyl-tripeptide--D-alanyl-D-alanine ligase [Anaplasmataceae bacterium]
MKNRIIQLLQTTTKFLTRCTIWRYRPGIVGVTGSVGKTSTKMAITAVLSSERRVRPSPSNFNNELGLPLSVLSSEEEIKGKLFWIKILFGSLWRIIRRGPYPEILVLEYGIDKPGDMKYLLSIARPMISVMTEVSPVPPHVEFFENTQALLREKGRIIEQLPVGGYAVLNFDSELVMSLRERTRGHVITYGFNKEADVRLSAYDIRIENGRATGITFKIEYGGSFVPVRLDNMFGRTHCYAAGAAAAVGISLGMNLVKISEALMRGYEPPKHRLQLLPGIKETFILDDAYNASPSSMRAGLETLKEIPAKRKVAVLGDMLEIGEYAMAAHEEIGVMVEDVATLLITIGPRAKFIAEGARQAGFNKKNIWSFDTADEARATVQEVIKKGDLILIKGSHAMQLEKIVEEIQAF